MRSRGETDPTRPTERTEESEGAKGGDRQGWERRVDAVKSRVQHVGGNGGAGRQTERGDGGEVRLTETGDRQPGGCYLERRVGHEPVHVVDFP